MKPESVELIKKEFHHLDTTYFNSAYFGPSPFRAKQKINLALEKELNPSFYPYETWMEIPGHIRYKFAQLVGCPEDHIALSTSTSDIVSLVANGIDWKDGDRVCAINKDYPSNVLPWMVAEKHHPFELQLLDLEAQNIPTAEWLAKSLPQNCKVFNMSWVTFDTGKCMDIESIGKLCQEREILFLVDGTQALGGMAIKPQQLAYLDILACSTYKWMLGPYGSALGYFSNRAIQKIHRQNGSWIVSPKSKRAYDLLDYTIETLGGACQFDRGQSPNMLTNACLEASLDFLNEIGLKNIQAHNQQLRDYFLENFPKEKFEIMTPKENMANIICLKAIQANPLDLERELKHRNVDISIRQGNLRLSFHLFNNKDQVNELIKALEI